MIALKQVAHRPDRDNLAVGQRGDAIADRVETGEIMGDHEHGQTERLLQRLDQRIEIAGRDRVQPRGRLVEEYDRRVQRECARQRHPLGHAARQFRRKLVSVFGPQPDHFELGGRDLVHQRLRQHEILTKRKLDVLPHGQGREQRALLEQDAPSRRDVLRVALARIADRLPHHLDRAAAPGDEADDGAHQHRLAAAGRADQAKDFAAVDIQRQMVEHGLAAEADHEIADANGEFGHPGLHRYIPIDAKKTANRPSSTITRKIDFTTEVVVCRPSDSALPLTRRPSLQATMPITSAMNGALMMPTSKCVTDTASCSRAMKIAGPMSP
jgi:hypothetical protein